MILAIQNCLQSSRQMKLENSSS